jgi:hypothetical protein
VPKKVSTCDEIGELSKEEKIPVEVKKLLEISTA